MPERLLLVGSDPAWLQAISMLLEAPEAAAAGATAPAARLRLVGCADDAAALAALDAEGGDPFAAVLIYGFHAGAGGHGLVSLPGYAARELAINLRARRRTLPILFAAPVRLDLLQRFAASTADVTVIEEESIDSIGAALGRTGTGTPGPQPWAQVDIFIGIEAVKVRVTLADGRVLADMPVASDMRPFLEDAQTEFHPWELYKYDSPGEPRVNDGWPARLRAVGERLHQYLVSDPQRKAIEACLGLVRSMDDIHFRFVTDRVAFPDVPFEAILDRGRKKFVRDMSPLARRILLRPVEATVSMSSTAALPASSQLTGRVLAIKSDTGGGSLRVGQHRFRGEDSKGFRRLPDLQSEIDAIQAARSRGAGGPADTCVLESCPDAVAALEAAIGNGPWDIVHFCGHSVRSDDDEVFLVLPGDRAGRLTGLSMGRFAQILRRAQASLLILSSCEGASSHGVFRAAQEGVPATIGFRWEVKSSEATTFCARLHERLAAGAPLGRAYLGAVRVLTPDRPAFLSAMLVVQQDNWAQPDPGVGG